MYTPYQVVKLQPEQIVRLMEEYSKIRSFWDRSLFYASAAAIADRPQHFTVSASLSKLGAVGRG